MSNQKFLLRRSSVKGKMPSSATGSSVEIGELLLNNASGSDAENFLTSLRAGGSSAVTSDYIKWSDDATNEKKFATKVELEDNELVISTIVTKINDSCGFNENSESVLPNKQSLTDAIVELQNDKSNYWKKTDRVNSAYTAYSATTSVSATTAKSATTAVSATTAKSASTVTSRVPSASTSYSATTSVSATTAASATTAKSASTVYAITGSGTYYLLGHNSSSNGNYSVYKNSNVYMNNGSIFAASDRTLKTHIEDIDGSLDKIKRIPKVYFHWNNDEDNKRQMGTYAQDLEEVYPELVTKDKDGIRAVAYDRLGVVALAGIDKLYDMVQELMKKNDELEKRIKELEENK